VSEFITSLSNDALDEMKSIDKINAVIAKLCRHKDIRAAQRRIRDGLLKPGDDPSVDRQAILAALMRRFEPDKKKSTRLMSPEETLVLPVAVAREWMKLKTEKRNHKPCVAGETVRRSDCHYRAPYSGSGEPNSKVSAPLESLASAVGLPPLRHDDARWLGRYLPFAGSL
jgi:hypothetical protein